MASKVMKYTTDLGEVFGVNVDDEIYGELNVSGSSFDEEASNDRVLLYADFDAFEAENAEGVMLPARIQPRSITLNHVMGSKTLIAPTPFVLAELELLEGSAAFGAGTLNITRIQGEAQNNPEIEGAA